EVAAAAHGIDVVRTRATMWGISGAYIALAGCLSAYQFGFVGPTAYNFALSVQMLFGLVNGGMQSLGGAIIGGLFLQFFPDLTAGLGKGLSALLYDVLLIGAIVAMPKGVAGVIAALPPGCARRRAAAVPPGPVRAAQPAANVPTGDRSADRAVTAAQCGAHDASDLDPADVIVNPNAITEQVEHK